MTQLGDDPIDAHLSESTVLHLARLRKMDRDVFRSALGRVREEARAAAGRAAVMKDRAERAVLRQMVKDGVSDDTMRELFDLTGLDADTQTRLIAIRVTGDLMRYATELGLARLAAAERRK
jgi:hypothetical protein